MNLQIRQRILYAIDCMKSVHGNQDRCILCGWTRVDAKRDGNCGRTPGSETLLNQYNIDKEFDGKHLWFTDVYRYIDRLEDIAKFKDVR